jgi:hypothetical protein
MSNDTTISAIPTRYKGYRFRSRTEARWAVYFDALGIEYIYEPEGYVLPDGTWYLPDFWLPQVSMFAEVKGKAFTEAEIAKCAALDGCSGMAKGINASRAARFDDRSEAW